MRTMLLLCVFSFIFLEGQAQTNLSKVFIEVSLARYARVPALFDYIQPQNQLDFVNGIKVGFVKHQRTERYLSLMNFVAARNWTDGFTGEFYSSRGYQFGAGINRRVFQWNRLSGSLGGEFLFQMVYHQGEYRTDTGIYTLDNIKKFETGFAGVAQVNYRLNQRLSLSANTRIGFYHNVRTGNEDFDQDIGYHYRYDPINSLALRVNLN